MISKDKGFAEIGEFVFGTDGSGAENLMVKSFGARQRNATGLESVDDDGHIRRDDYLYMNGSAIFNFTLETVPAMINDLLKKSELERSDIDYFIFHQANKYMLNTIRKVCGIEKDKFYINIENTGNTVSPTILISLTDCLNNGTLTPGMKVMACGFGVGLSYAATVLYLNK